MTISHPLLCAFALLTKKHPLKALNIQWKDWCWSWNSNTFGHLMWRTHSLEKTLMLGKTEGMRRRGQQRMRWLDGIADSMDILLLLLLSHFSRVRLWATHRRQPTRLPHPWDSPGKNTGVGCHFLLQCMKVKSESEVAQSCPTLSIPTDCGLPGSSIHGIL